MKPTLLAAVTLCACSGEPAAPAVAPFLAGAAAVDLTPPGWERFDDANGNHLYDEPEETFLDCGRDQLCPGDEGYAAPDEDGSENDGTFQVAVLAGYGGRLTQDPWRPALDQNDPVWARALAMTRGDETVVLVSMDFAGFLHTVANPVKRRVEAELGVPAARIITSATHNHDGPDIVGFWEGAIQPAYKKQVQDGLFESIRAALDARVGVTVTTAAGKPEHGCWDSDTHDLLAPQDCELPLVEKAPGRYHEYLWQSDTRDPVVRNMTVTAARFDAVDGSGTVATLVSWNNHPEILGGRNSTMSSDFPHYARQRIEASYGGIAVYVSGTTGSQISAINHADVPLYDEAGEPVFEDDVTTSGGAPFPVFATYRSIERIRSIGTMVADVAMAALQGTEAEEDPMLKLHTRPLHVPIDNGQIAVALALFIPPSEIDDPADELVRAGGYCDDVPCVPTRAHLLHLGGITAVSGPGEIAPEYILGRPGAKADYTTSDGYEGARSDYAYPAMDGLASHLPERLLLGIDIADTYLGYMVPAADYLPPSLDAHPNYFEDLASAGERYGDIVSDAWLELLGIDREHWIDPIRPLQPAYEDTASP